MSWVRAVWQEKTREEEEVVPASWIVDRMMHWPTSIKAGKAMKEGRHPTDGKTKWDRFPMIKEKIRAGNSLV
jgi:hypothetical protein